MLSGRGICSTRAPPADEAGAENVGGIEDPSKKWPFKRFSLLKVGSSAHKHTLAYATTEQVHKGEEPEAGTTVHAAGYKAQHPCAGSKVEL